MLSTFFEHTPSLSFLSLPVRRQFYENLTIFFLFFSGPGAVATNDTNNFHLNEAMNKKPMQVDVVLCEKRKEGEISENKKRGSGS